MRMIIALPLLAAPLVALAACNVTTDDKNDQVTVQYNQDLAENAVADTANKAQEIAGEIGNDVKETSEKVQQKADNVDVDVDVKTDGEKANANAN